jgi:hypothetical protein
MATKQGNPNLSQRQANVLDSSSHRREYSGFHRFDGDKTLIESDSKPAA